GEHLLHEFADRGVSLQDPGLNRLDVLVQLPYPRLRGDPLLPKHLEEVGLLLDNRSRVAVDQSRHRLRFTEDRRCNVLGGIRDSEVSRDTVKMPHLDGIIQLLDQPLVLPRYLSQEPHFLAGALPLDGKALRSFDPHYNQWSVRVRTDINLLPRHSNKSKYALSNFTDSLEY